MNTVNWLTAFPEIFLLTMACVISLCDLWVTSPQRGLTYGLTLLTLGLVALAQAVLASTGNTVYGFGHMVVSDAMGNWLKCFATLSVMATLVYGKPYSADRKMLQGGELFILSMFSLLGMFIMISGNNFLVLYLGLELLTLSSYALVALRRDNSNATEAAMKYFVLGALASGFLLYGLSMLYGATGTLDLTAIFQATSSGHIKHQVLVLGVVFVVCGIAFKLGAAPFHMWAPDVYQGAPTSVTLLLGAAPKLAAFAICMRLLVEGLGALAADWQQMLVVMSVASLVIGNITALAQTNIKRMLAYSTISQMGFMLLGLASGVFTGSTAEATASAYSASMFYTITYVLTTLGSFATIMLLSRQGFEAEQLDDFKGLNQRSPWFAAMMMLLMLSLAGVPPMVGFYAKLSVLQAALEAGQVALVIFAVMMSLVGAFYYLRVIKLMYFDDAIDTAPISVPKDMQIVLSINGAATLVLGLLPSPLMSACLRAITQALAS